MQVEDLQAFEKEIADIYATGSIRHPVHLRASEDGQYEKHMIEAFKKFEVTKDDYFYGFWDSHIAALLKGVPRDRLKDAIIAGESIALNFPDYNFFCSGIVGSLMGVAVGTAFQLKREGKGRKVILYCGDMSSYLGIFHEALQYSINFDLPIGFIVGNNSLSVMTDTMETWGNQRPIWLEANEHISCFSANIRIYYFWYKNSWPHSGLHKRIEF